MAWPGSDRRIGHGRLMEGAGHGAGRGLDREGQGHKGFEIGQRGILDPAQGNKEAIVAPVNYFVQLSLTG